MTLSTYPGRKVRGVFVLQSTGLICVIMMPAAAAAAVTLNLKRLRTTWDEPTVQAAISRDTGLAAAQSLKNSVYTEKRGSSTQCEL